MVQFLAVSSPPSSKQTIAEPTFYACSWQRVNNNIFCAKIFPLEQLPFKKGSTHCAPFFSPDKMQFTPKNALQYSHSFSTVYNKHAKTKKIFLSFDEKVKKRRWIDAFLNQSESKRRVMSDLKIFSRSYLLSARGVFL